MQKFLYSFHWNCGRQGDLDGRFLASPDQIKNAIGKELYFGEVLGKHSEIFGSLAEDDITLVTDNVPWLQEANELGIDLQSGFNPLEYFQEEM